MRVVHAAAKCSVSCRESYGGQQQHHALRDPDVKSLFVRKDLRDKHLAAPRRAPQSGRET